MDTMAKETTNMRRMLRSDIDAVISLEREIGGGLTAVSRRDLIITDPGGPLDFSFVYEAGGKIVGFVLARLEYLGIPFVPICCISGVGVKREYQRQSIGSQLINKVLDLCYAKGISKARAFLDKDNTEIRSFAKELGFKPSNILNYDIDFEYTGVKPSTRQW
jgi:ribosomal protein S18 acetylase RimI-like enzyme